MSVMIAPSFRFCKISFCWKPVTSLHQATMHTTHRKSCAHIFFYVFSVKLLTRKYVHKETAPQRIGVNGNMRCYNHHHTRYAGLVLVGELTQLRRTNLFHSDKLGKLIEKLKDPVDISQLGRVCLITIQHQMRAIRPMLWLLGFFHFSPLDCERAFCATTIFL